MTEKEQQRRTEGPYNNYSSYLKHIYGEPVYRVAVDAGFSCPNRGLDRLKPGCVYCDERGAKAPYLGDEMNVRQQVEGALAFLRKRYKTEAFILYFQAFSSTYAPVEQLKKIYDHALKLAPFKELIISSRPDCVNEEVAELLGAYVADGYTTWMELGLQSSFNKTLERINRGHTVEQFQQACKLLKAAGVRLTVHLIFGLPGEGEQEILESVRFVAALKPHGIKIHNLHIPLNTPLYEEFLMGEIRVPSAEEHLEYTIKALELLPPETVIMRVTCDTPADLLAHPRNFWNKAHFYSRLRQEMINRKTWQGRLYKALD